MPEPIRIVVRDTPVDLLRAGSGPPLLYLHGAGGGGRWLTFQERLAERFDVLAPSHPGHGGSPAAEWIEHISDLAFHYLDLLDTLEADGYLTASPDRTRFRFRMNLLREWWLRYVAPPPTEG